MVKITVTQSDIDWGIKGSCRFCPVARALMRRFPKSIISVGPSHMIIDQLILITPYEVGRWIRNFDVGHRVLPFEFDLEIPDALDTARSGNVASTVQSCN